MPGKSKQYNDEYYYNKLKARYAEYGIEWTPDMKGKSLQSELKKRGKTLSDKIPDIAEGVKKITENMATKNKQDKTHAVAVLICSPQTQKLK